MTGSLLDVDVAVIGAGGAGIACAIEAAARGARVAILDSAARAGGTAAGAGGGTCIAGSPLQAGLGIADSVDLALADWAAWGGASADLAWAERYLRASVGELFERLAGLGVRWVEVVPQEGNSVPRWHRPAGGGGAVMAALERQARGLPGISWLLGHRVTRLVSTGGRVTGVVAVGQEGDVEIVARSVVVASGGFGNDPEMVAEHAVEPGSVERILLGGGVGARGAGHRVLAEKGAQFSQLDAVWMYPYATPDPRDPDGRRGLALRGIDGDIWVNDEGRRFHDESLRGGATGAPALLRQPGGRAWAVIDARIAARMRVGDPFYTTGGAVDAVRVRRLLETSPFVVSAPTTGLLAERMGVDGDALGDAVGGMNSAIAAGLDRDPALGKPLTGLDPLEEAPFFAVRLHPLVRKNLGGVRTDAHCRVLDREGRAIDGLLAAGEVAGMAGGRINGRAALEGTMFGPSIYSGMVAGRTAAS